MERAPDCFFRSLEVAHWSFLQEVEFALDCLFLFDCEVVDVPEVAGAGLKCLLLCAEGYDFRHVGEASVQVFEVELIGVQRLLLCVLKIKFNLFLLARPPSLLAVKESLLNVRQNIQRQLCIALYNEVLYIALSAFIEKDSQKLTCIGRAGRGIPVHENLACKVLEFLITASTELLEDLALVEQVFNLVRLTLTQVKDFIFFETTPV